MTILPVIQSVIIGAIEIMNVINIDAQRSIMFRSEILRY